MMFNKDTLDRIEELQRNEELLYNCINYLEELWRINDKEEKEKHFKYLGFTKEDIERLEIEL